MGKATFDVNKDVPKFLSMNPRYKGEDNPKTPVFFQEKKSPFRVFPKPDDKYKPDDSVAPLTVKYCSDQNKAAFRIRPDEAGLVGGQVGKVVAKLQSPANVPDFIYVEDVDASVYASPFSRVGSFHHSTFTGGKDVKCAGYMTFNDGAVVYLDNSSGHYRPHPGALYRFAMLLNAVPVKGINSAVIKVFFCDDVLKKLQEARVAAGQPPLP